MQSEFLNSPYYTKQCRKPTIISPKTDSHWTDTKTDVDFDWNYNGLDGQYQYRIQVFNIPYTYLSATIDEEQPLWYTDTNLDNSAAIIAEAIDAVSFDSFSSTNLITGGTFADSTNWTIGTDWSISGGVASRAAASIDTLENTSFTCTSGKRYKVIYTITATSATSATTGTLNFTLGGVDGIERSTAGTFSETITTTSASTLTFQANNSTAVTFSIDNVNVREEVPLDTGIITSINTDATLDLTFLPEDDGVFIWRMQTKGYMASTWSNWANDGLVRIDANTPVIRNACIETYYDSYRTISLLSDLSSPYMYKENEDSYKIRGVDSNENSGLYIYYDYKEEALVLRGRGWDSTSNTKRYYGMLTFHAEQIIDSFDRTQPYTPFHIMDVVDGAIVYTIERDGTYGPSEKIKSNFALDHRSLFVTENNVGTTSAGNFLPKGLPNYDYETGIYYEDINTQDHPSAATSSTTYLSSFPWHTFKVPGNKRFIFPGTTTEITFGTSSETLVEMRYPAPFQDVFILFKDETELRKILAYGQYKNWNQIVMLPDEDGYLDSAWELNRGWDVENNRDARTSPADTSNTTYKIFESNTYIDSTNPGMGSISDRLKKTGITDNNGNGEINFLPHSHSLYFNIALEEDKDTAIKIFLNPRKLTSLGVNGFTSGINLFSTEFHMYPKTDCCNVNDRNYESNILIDEVNIGRSIISPRDLSVFIEENYGSNRKKYYKNVKYGVPYTTESFDQILDTKEFAIGSEYSYFVNNYTINEDNISYTDQEFNGSFRIKIPPEYDYIPYYHANSVSLADADSDYKSPLPHIFNASPVSGTEEDTVGWDSLILKTSNSVSSNDGLVKDDYIYNTDFARFMSTSRILGQPYPYYYNEILWDALTNTRGKIINHHSYWNKTSTKKTFEYGFNGNSIYNGGYSKDSVVYNKIDRGLYGIVDTLGESGSVYTTKLFLKDFSNFLFRRSVEYVVETTAIDGEDKFTSAIKPNNYSYTGGPWSFGGTNNILQSSANTNGPGWIYNLASDTSFASALISYDSSMQGNHGENGISVTNWLSESGLSSSFSGQYLISTNGEGEQVLRMVKDNPTADDTLMLRGILDKEDLSVGTGLVSGDTLSLGNVFGKVYLHDTSERVVRMFFDIGDSSSGIKEMRYFIQTIPTELVSSSPYIGDDIKNTITLQTINNYSDTAADYSTDAYANVQNFRTSMTINQRFLETRSYNTITNSGDVISDTDLTGYGVNRFYVDVIVGEAAYYILHLQVKNKVDKESNIYSIAIKTEDEATIDTSLSPIESVIIATDNGDVFTETETSRTRSDGTTNYTFTTTSLQQDQLAARSIVVKNILRENGTDYTNTNDLLMGFSDNFGLHYNVYSPFSSVNIWDFSRPIVINTKSFDYFVRGNEPDWYFDPNNIRHYSIDSTEELTLNSAAGYAPGNVGLSETTLIGLMNESGTSKSNPLAEKMYNFREELIGKKLIIGNNLDLKYTILHIFKTNILPTKRSNLTTNIDSDTKTKVWILVEDSNAIGALVLSRKAQYYDSSHSKYTEYRGRTGWRQYVSSTSDADYTIKTTNFGYADFEDFDEDYMEIANEALGIDPPSDLDGEIPGIVDFTTENLTTENVAIDYQRESFYISQSSLFTKSSGLQTQEDWTTRIFKLYANKTYNTVSSWENFNHSNFVGLETYDRLIFGENYEITSSISYVDSSNNAIFVSTDSFDATMGSGLYGTSGAHDGFTYEIWDSAETSAVKTGQIIDVSDNGKCIIVDGGVWTEVDSSVGNISNLTFKVIITPLQSTDSNGVILTKGWHPDIDGTLIPAGYLPMGSSSTNYLQFAVISTGSFYVDTTGTWTFKVDVDSASYGDFYIDYMRATGDITGVGDASDNYVGGFVKNGETTSNTFYLRKGWHIGRFRYMSSGNNAKTASVSYKKPRINAITGVETSSAWMPFVASRNTNKTFWAKSHRSIHGKILDKDYNEYPSSTVDTTSESQYCRAIIGINALESTESSVYSNKVAWIENLESTSIIGNVKSGKSTSSAAGRTYGGQIYEEAVGIYKSNIFDGGADVKFWRNLKWTESNTTSDTTVQFYIRSAPTEEVLLIRKWNDIGASDSEIILSAFTDSTGNNILRFSQFFSATNQEDETSINRFIQFKMILKTKDWADAPRVHDVTIEYSKESSVNFFTTTFDLNSNILRGILAYNGDMGVENESDASLVDIQFGISTEETSADSGIISTNFDDYTIIPTNEAFMLSSLGISENDKFRIGIRFVSSSTTVPTVDEFAMMFETLGKDSDGAVVRDDTTLDLRNKI